MNDKLLKHQPSDSSSVEGDKKRERERERDRKSLTLPQHQLTLKLKQANKLTLETNQPERFSVTHGQLVVILL
jgi:hypothetical protein